MSYPPKGTVEKGLVTQGPTLTVGILAAAGVGCQPPKNLGLTCEGRKCHAGSVPRSSSLLRIWPGGGSSQEAKSLSNHPSDGLGVMPLCSPWL